MEKFHHHDMLPALAHDERARQEFVGAFRSHLARRVMPGNYRVFERRVAPQLRAQADGSERDPRAIREAMRRDGYYQFWSAMQRRSQELMWESVIDPTERELPHLIAQARRLWRAALARSSRGSLRLDSAFKVPRYHTVADIHLQPGGYHTDFATDDVSAGAIYDRALNIYSQGSTGAENDSMGALMVGFFREHYPGCALRRMLDMGCAIGNSTLPWARAFPQAEVHAIDVAAPVLRYAHARAVTLGHRVHFSQQNAEHTDFAPGSFDVVASHIMLHETSRSAIVNIMRECHRLLRPGGVMLHLEIPRGRTPLEKFLYNWETWNNNETFAAYMTDLDLGALATQGGFMLERIEVVDYAAPRAPGQNLYSEDFHWKILAAER